jgi:hypothetical protein
MNAKISLLTKEIEALKLKGSRGVNAVYREDSMEACRICQEIDHTTSAYKSLSQFLRGSYGGMLDLPRNRSYHKCM